MPIIVEDRNGNVVEGGHIIFRGGCCLGVLFLLVLAMIGLTTLINLVLGTV